MTEKPILMNAEMVQATLDNRKRQTRRVVNWERASLCDRPMKGQLNGDGYMSINISNAETHRRPWTKETLAMIAESAPYQVGDHLYVRETFAAFTTPHHEYGDCDEVDEKLDDLYLERCGYPEIVYKADNKSYPNKWRPSIHMPKWATRTWLEVTNVRVERVQDISEDDAQAEGVRPNWSGNLDGWNAEEHGFLCQEAIKYTEEGREFADPYFCTAKEAFFSLWDSLATPETNWNANPWVFVYDFERIEK